MRQLKLQARAVIIGSRDYRVLRRAFIAALTLVAVQGCAAGSGQHVHGRVIDADTGQPIQNAYVYARSGYYKCGPAELGGCGCVTVDAALTRTNADGHYRFERPFKFGGGLFSDKFGTVTVYKTGYENTKSNFQSDKTSGYNIKSLFSQFFYGSGRYESLYKSYNIKLDSRKQKLTNQPIKSYEKRPNITHRLLYLINVLAGLGPPACLYYGSNKAKIIFNKFQEIIIRDALSLIKTPQDKKIVDTYLR
ncbi:hypothetical protein [Salinisphaera sp.]|uniref:carboxypeptidase-like regulatory domain-containing protein n=1 Tax=Salinisphaera sp. TaxID=1914330 RepID=UPI002D769E46|nr:hypothetical protein [Salinisphaera sp.]HET7315207.1 hypothetical protein [Salinisphaera sp.]